MSAIIPGILEQEWGALQRKIEIAQSFADTIHIDLLDGKFAENHSFMDPAPFADYTKDTIFEVHLMVDNPLQYIRPFAQAGFQRFLGHVEMMPDQAAFVAEGEQYGEVGLVLDAHTPLHTLTVATEDLDSLLIMSVKAGFSGQHFLEDAFTRIASMATKYPLLTIEVDGGIQAESLAQAYRAGARRFVATSAIFGAEDPHLAYTSLTEIVGRVAEESVLVERNESS